MRSVRGSISGRNMQDGGSHSVHRTARHGAGWRRHRFAAALFLFATLASPLARAGGQDTVLLSNGGRVRGIVIEDDPKTGVSIKLADGSIRRLTRGEVKQVVYASDATSTPPAAPVPAAPTPVAVPPALPAAAPPSPPATAVPLVKTPTTAECLAANEAAVKAAGEHKLRTERAQFLVCAAPSCPADVRKDCGSRGAEVERQIPTIVFSVKDSAGIDLNAVKVTMEGEVLAERLDGTPLLVDAGEHTFTFESAGLEPVTKKLVLQEGQKSRLEDVGMLARTGPAAAPVAAPPAAPLNSTPPPAALPPAAASTGGLGTQKVLAIVAGGVGIVGLGLGAAFGGIAMSDKSSAQSACPLQCSGGGEWSSAATAGNVSTAMFIVGGVGLAGAAVLWFTAPSSHGSSTKVGLGPGGLLLKGTW
jgi:hypothetical protein